MKRFIFITGLFVILGAVTLLWPATTPTIPTATIAPSIINAGTTTVVTITVPISDPTLTAGSVNLISLGSTGLQSVILGQFHDDGKNGDAIAGDNIYTIQYPFFVTSPEQLQLEVSAAFKGQLKRIVSPIATLTVWGVLVAQASGFRLAYPPTVYNVTGSDLLIDTVTGAPLPGLFLLSSSPLGVSDGATGLDPTLSPAGYNIRIVVSPFSGTFDVNSWLTSQYPDITVGTVTPVIMGPATGYQFQFTNGEGAGWPRVVVNFGGEIYLLTYSSTFAAGSSADQTGLDAFAQIIQNITFLN